MAKFTIYSKDGLSVRHIGEPQFSGSYMGVDYIEFRTISSPSPVTWEIGDYVDYYRTGLRYKLYSLPMPNKVARRGVFGASFEYSNVQLHAATKELEIAPFRDLVPEDNLIHFTTRQDFSTHENVYGIARRIQACMDDIFPGKWQINVVDTNDEKLLPLLRETKEFSASGISCLDALSQIYDTWQNVGWVHTYDTENEVDIITIGGANTRTRANTSSIFGYGHGYGLTSLKKASANPEEFATRLYIYGSERNIQTRYYNQFNIINKDSVDIRNLMIPIENWGKTDGVPDAKKAYLQADNATIEKFGLIPRTVYFDGSQNEEICPTIKNLTMKIVREEMIANGQGSSAFLPASLEKRIDKVDSTYSSYDYDDGSKENTEKRRTFRLGLRPFGFDVIEQGKLTSEGYATISMISGACAGREFKIRKDTGARLYDGSNLVGIVYEIEKVWDESLGMGFPNITYPIKPEDEFVLLDIPMPDYYITIASKRLLAAGQKMLTDYTKVSAFYEPSIDPIVIKGYNKPLRVGMYMAIRDEDIIETDDNFDYVLIDTLTIDESAQLPQYKVTLREQKRSSRSFSTLVDMIEDAKEESKQSIAATKRYTERKFRTAQETLEMLQGALKNFSEGVNPITVNTMGLLVGDESLQFKFISATGSSMKDVESSLIYDSEYKVLASQTNVRLMHMTLGVNDVTPMSARSINSYKKWLMPVWNSETLEDAEKSYYLYAQVPQNGTVGKYELFETPQDLEVIINNQPCYNLLVGILNAEYDGTRSYVELYGFTEVLPGRITTDIIKSADGKTYFDLARNVLNVGEKTGLSGTDEYLRMWAGAAYANRFNAPFKVTDEGELIADKAIVKGEVYASGGKIGSLNILEKGLAISEWPSGSSNGDVFGLISLLRSAVSFSAMKQKTSTTASSIRNVLIDLENKSADTATIVINAEKTSIKCPTGSFDGLRTKTKTLRTTGSSSSPHELTEFDFNVLIPATSGTYHIELPDTPIDGQEYWIETFGADATIYSNKQMWGHYYGKYETSSHTFTGRGTVRFKYYEAAATWTYTWVELIS